MRNNKNVLKKSIFLIYQTPDYGGTRTFFYQLAEYLLKRDYKIYLLVKVSEFTGEIPDYCSKNKILVLTWDDEIKLSPLDSFRNIKINLLISYNYLKQIFYLRGIYKKIKPEFTMVSQGWPFIWFKALFLPGKLYFFSHVMPLHPLDKGNLLLLKIGLLKRRCAFIAVSDFAGNKMRGYWVGKYKKLITIHNYFEPKAESGIRNRKSETLTILALARVEDGKNPLLWIEIAKEIVNVHPHVRFIWAGEGSLLESAKKLTKDNKKIQFIGYHLKVDELYVSADIYFEPSKRESHGISVVGALAYGIPAIATSYGGTVETVIDDYNGYIVDVTDKEQMIDRLLKLIDDANLRDEMGKKGFQRWKEMFTKEIWEKKMDSLLGL